MFSLRNAGCRKGSGCESRESLSRFKLILPRGFGNEGPGLEVGHGCAGFGAYCFQWFLDGHGPALDVDRVQFFHSIQVRARGVNCQI